MVRRRPLPYSDDQVRSPGRSDAPQAACAGDSFLSDAARQELQRVCGLIAPALRVTHLALILAGEGGGQAAVTLGWSPHTLSTLTADELARPFEWSAGRRAGPSGDDPGPPPALRTPPGPWALLAGVPLATPPGHPPGLLVVGRQSGRRYWTGEQRALLSSGAQQLSQVLAHHAAQPGRAQRALRAARGRLTRAAHEARVFRAIADLAAQALNGQDVLGDAARLAAELIGVDWSGVQATPTDPLQGAWPAHAAAWVIPAVPRPARGSTGTLDGTAGWTLADGRPAAVAWTDVPGHPARLVFLRLGAAARWTAADRRRLSELTWALRHLLSFAAQRTALSGLEGQLRFALSSIPMLLWVTDPDDRLTVVEGSALRRLGAQPEQLLGRSLISLVGDVLTLPPGHPVGAEQRRSVTLAERVYDVHQVPLPRGGQLGVAFDVTELTASQTAAREAQQHAETLLELTRTLPVSGQLSTLSAQALDVLLPALRGSWLVFWTHDAPRQLVVPLVTCGDVPPGILAVQARGFSAADRYMARLLAGETLQLDAGHLPGPVREAGLQAALLIPFTAGRDSYVLGAYRRDAGTWSAQERDLLTVATRVLQVNLERRDTVEQLRQAATTDPLTGLGNRRAFEADIGAALRDEGADWTLVTLDVDGLKLVNDRDGHARGDELLRAVGRALRGALRDGDTSYRVGGDEFCLLLRGTQSDAAQRLTQALLAVRDAGFPGAGASVGVAYAPAEGRHAETLWQLADERMYGEKTRRRHR